MATPQCSIYGFDQAEPISPLALLKGERRAARFPLVLSVRFQSGGPVKGRSGAGVTRDFSSRGMFIETDSIKAKPGSRVKVIAEWPVLLEGSVPLQFIAFG